MIIKLLTLLAVIALITAPVLIRVRYASHAQAKARQRAYQEAIKDAKFKRELCEALSTLKLPHNPSKVQIKQAHKKLMRKNHPDLGGSKALATKINVARDVLLKEAA